jgi:pyridoxine 4-dehydrogenase
VDSLIAAMARIAVKHQKTVGDVAINYCVCKGVIPIVGVRDGAQAEKAVKNGQWRMTAAEVRELERVKGGVTPFNGAGAKIADGKFVGYGVERWSME